MSRPYPRKFEYEEAVHVVAQSIVEDAYVAQGHVIAASAFALSLTCNVHVTVVAADIKAAMARISKEQK